MPRLSYPHLVPPHHVAYHVLPPAHAQRGFGAGERYGGDDGWAAEGHGVNRCDGAGKSKERWDHRGDQRHAGTGAQQEQDTTGVSHKRYAQKTEARCFISELHRKGR